jgi:hypothetical protein
MNGVSRATLASVAALASTVATVAAASPSAAHASDYYGKFRVAYRPVQATLDRVSAACAFGAVTRVYQLPACGNRVAQFRTAVARLLQFLTHSTPPAKAKADVRAAVATTGVVQQRFTTLAALIKRKNLVRFKAMGGEGHPIDKAITAFNTALGNLEIDLIP